MQRGLEPAGIGTEELLLCLASPRSLNTDCRPLLYPRLSCVEPVNEGGLASFEVSLGFQFGCGGCHGADGAIASDRFESDLMC